MLLSCVCFLRCCRHCWLEIWYSIYTVYFVSESIYRLFHHLFPPFNLFSFFVPPPRSPASLPFFSFTLSLVHLLAPFSLVLMPLMILSPIAHKIKWADSIWSILSLCKWVELNDSDNRDKRAKNQFYLIYQPISSVASTPINCFFVIRCRAYFLCVPSFYISSQCIVFLTMSKYVLENNTRYRWY